MIMRNQYLIGLSVISIGLDRSVPECNHKEAGTRIVVHVIHAIQADQAKSVVVRTVDTDVLVILIGSRYQVILIGSTILEQSSPAWTCG